MIYDSLKNAGRYFNCDSSAKKALEFIKTLNKDSETGSFIIDENAKVNVVSYSSQLESDCAYESHKKYIDIHVMISGSESIDAIDINRLEPIGTFDNENDYILLKPGDGFKRFTLTPGDFLAVYPDEAHRPSVAVNETPAPVLKAIVKLLYR